ncbi:cytochrome c oxidase subunit II transmembrane domain-containing protein [Salmonella sp. s54836]|uniref:cytochrome c oxidase subunit II transmembrane domain-containing protein n=1 Tax=Salmonella sp. s54836 TaxID=3159673 RepID=UPI00397EC63D
MLVLYIICLAGVRSPVARGLLEAQHLEFLWTVFPGFILVALAIPSIKLLYYMDERNNPDVTVKSIGHQ